MQPTPTRLTEALSALSTEFVTFRLSTVPDVLEVTWQGSLDRERFQKLHEQQARALTLTGYTSILADTRSATLALSPKELWGLFSLMQPMYEAGLRRVAMVFPIQEKVTSNAPILLNTEHELFDVKLFSAIEPGLSWLRSQQISAAG